MHRWTHRRARKFIHCIHMNERQDYAAATEQWGRPSQQRSAGVQQRHSPRPAGGYIHHAVVSRQSQLCTLPAGPASSVKKKRKEKLAEKIHGGAGMGPGRGRGGARRALRAPGRCRPGPRQKPGGHAHRGRPRRAGPRARPRTHTHASIPVRAVAWRRIRMPRRAPRRGACVRPKSPARRQAGHRGLGDNAGAASPALASDGSLLHRRWHTAVSLSSAGAYGYRVGKSKARFRTSECDANIWNCLGLLMVVVDLCEPVD